MPFPSQTVPNIHTQKLQVIHWRQALFANETGTLGRLYTESKCEKPFENHWLNLKPILG